MGELMRPDRLVIRIQIRRERSMPRARHRVHHRVRSDHHQPVDRAQRNFRFVQIPAPVGEHRLDNISHESLVLRAARRESRRFVAAPDHHIRRFLDLLHLIAIDDLLISGEVNGPRSAGAQLLADREQHRVAQPSAHQQNRFLRRRFASACPWVPSGSPARPVSTARTDPKIRPFRARWSTSRPVRRSTDAPVSARPSIASVVLCVDPLAVAASVS